MDKIFISELKAEASIGVHNWEQQVTQMILIDAEIAYDITAAAKADDIEKTLDYGIVIQSICKFVQQKHFNLIEALITELADFLLAEYKVPWVKLKITKPYAISDAKHVSIVMERSA